MVDVSPQRTTRRRVTLVLLVVLVVGGSILAARPAWAVGSDPSCNPGNDCTGFERGTYEVTEGVEYVEINVLAAWCCPVGQGQIDYATVNGSAVGGRDFQHTSGTLTYAGGGWGGIRIPITDDTLAEGREQFQVRLKNFRGTFVNRGHETAVVSILDRTEGEGSVSSGSPGRSNSQVRGPQTGSSTPAARPSTGPAASPLHVAQQPLTTATPGPPAPMASGSLGAHTEQREVALSAVEPRGQHRPPLALVAGLVALLLGTVCVGWRTRPDARPT
jgi:hypothetical protein